MHVGSIEDIPPGSFSLDRKMQPSEWINLYWFGIVGRVGIVSSGTLFEGKEEEENNDELFLWMDACQLDSKGNLKPQDSIDGEGL